MSRVWAVAVIDGESGKEIFVGRENGSLEKYSSRFLQQSPPVATLTIADAHAGAITGLSLASGDEATTCSYDGTVKTFSTAAEVEGKREQKSTNCDTPLRCLLAAGEQTFVGGQDGSITIVGGEQPQKLLGHRDAVVALTMTETNLLSASFDATVRVWDLGSNKSVFILLGHTNHVKAVQFLNGYIFTASRDETLRMWTLPEAPEGGSAPAAEAAADGEDGAPAAAAAGDGSGDSPISVRAAAVVELPSAPHSVSVSGNNLYLGFTDRCVRSIQTKDLIRTVEGFKSEVNASFKKCKKHLENNAAIAIKNLRIINKKNLKEKKKSLLESAANAAKEAVAAAAAARAANSAPADEDEEAVEPVAEPEEGEEGEIALNEEQEKEYAEFVEAKKAELEKAIADVHAKKQVKIDALNPILKQQFLCEKEKFDRVTFTRTFQRVGPAAVTALVVDGITAYSGSDDKVTITDCRPGVTVL